MEFILWFLAGAVFGAVVALIASHLRAKSARSEIQAAFAALAGEALEANSRRLNEISALALDGKKELIDKSVIAVNERLEQIRQVLQRTEAERKQDVGKLTSTLASLSTTTGELHRMLASTQRRGAWGERMAEDVLRLAGLQEGINYSRQSGEDAESGRPDFTFFLPNDLKANMDVKFPLGRYKSYLDADSDDARKIELKQLVTAVRGQIQDVVRRGYIDPKIPTVPYVIVFIPAEQIYSLVLEAAPDLMDEALSKRVVLTSPLTLYAMLAVIRQAAENANLMQTADEAISLIGEFFKQWGKYNEEMDKLGDRIDLAARQFETVRTTRTNMLQRPLDKIEELRSVGGLVADQASED